MIHNRIITENHLDDWVRRDSRNAQGLIVELVWRLVAASVPKPTQRRFPLGDSIGQHGPDGVLETSIDFDPFIPKGKSFWEIGTNLDAAQKASDDYRDSTAAIPENIRKDSTFIFVTPLSGRRGWEHTWKEEAQASWLEKRRSKSDWQDIRIIDGTGLIDWLHYFPAVERWFAKIIGVSLDQLEIPEHRWEYLKSIGDPPPLIPEVFLTNRENACEKLKEVFSGVTVQLKIDSHFPNQVAEFVTAYLASLPEEEHIEFTNRCLIVTGAEGWKTMFSLREPHVLVAKGLELDEDSSEGMEILQKARRAGHAVIFAGLPGGIPHPNRIALKSPRDYQIQEALTKAGYNEERARSLALKSDGNLNSLLRCIQNLSLMPEWAQGSDTAELAVAALLGGWNEHTDGDRSAVEKLSGNSYGEWVGKIRETTLKPDTPLIQREGLWKIITRYEAWYCLGSRIHDDHLDRFKALALEVLGERDPKFDLPPENHFMANLLGKAPIHSHLLEKGIADTLALLGSHPKALVSCSFGKAESVAVLVIRELFADADAILWASLKNVMPLLAEAAPSEFLKAVETALNSDPCPFDWIYQQEGKGAMGGDNYMTGLLWALETLAWDANYLTRVIIILGGLAERDPGGNWGNRPANSLANILLPWYPQTCASIAKRKTAVKALLEESPEVGWKLLLALLPSTLGMSHGTRKPAWREIIPEDWTRDVSPQDYWEQTEYYAELATKVARQDIRKLNVLLERLGSLPPPAMERIIEHLASDNVVSMSESERLPIWEHLTRLVSKHRKSADCDWAMKPDEVDRIEEVANILAPQSKLCLYQRLFNSRDFELFEEKGNWEDQRKKLETARKEAIIDIYKTGEAKAVFEFAKALKSPWGAGISCGTALAIDIEAEILPIFLDLDDKLLSQFTAGFVVGRFSTLGWPWIENMDLSAWTISEKSELFNFLPFTQETWERLAWAFGKDESAYWIKTYVNPYQTEKGLEFAIDRLIDHGRPNEAVQCLERILNDKRLIDAQQSIRALKLLLNSPDAIQAMDQHAVVEIIRNLQADPTTNPADLFQLEWNYLPLLDEYHGATPTLLEHQLAGDPNFFCEVIRLIFRSRKQEKPTEEPSEQQSNLATNAYRLLSKWRTPPGSQKDGAFDGDALADWLEKVKASCEESGHLDVALPKLGEVLIHAPADPSGLWLHHAVANVLNAKDAEPMRNGYKTAWRNSRGVHWVDPTGQQERDLAQCFRVKAEAVDAEGYFRLAETLRKIADSYDYEAERRISNAEFDD